jgi:hypothetical protein
MHIVGPYLTTTRTSTKKKKSNSKKLIEATDKHNEWLAKKGLSAAQIKMKKAFIGNVRTNNESNVHADNPYQLSNGIGNGFKQGIMTKLHKEAPAVQKEILDKAKRTAPAYSKGAYQYITPGANLSDIGKKK